MDMIEKSILEKHFSEVKPESNGRYNRDNIMTVLGFMKNHSSVHIRSIAEYSSISLGTLVHWRKKYGKYIGIRVKGAKDEPSYEDTYHAIESETLDKADRANSTSLDSKRLRIPIELIEQLQKLNNRGINSEFTIDAYSISIEHSFLCISTKTN